ncbi:MAG: phage/plasmid primase, P4 family [Armatimonadota bacterium]|nr:phage/plasmid primase, P4 family [bacterium]
MSINREVVTAVEAALTAITESGQVVELRVLDYMRPGSSYPCTMSGYFDDYRAMAEEAAKLTPHASGVYFTPNPVKPELLARVCNKTRAMGKGDSTTSDKDVIRRRWFLIDCDAARVSGISASDEEHAAAISRAETIRTALSGEGWPEPILADSGNGGHLMYRVDIPTDDKGLVKACLEALAQRFNSDGVHVDTAVFNPARIWKLPGTLARKGEDMPGRPHRLAKLLNVPEPLEVVAAGLLQTLAETANAEVPAIEHPIAGGFDLVSWISSHLGAASHKRTAEGEVWTIEVCPFNPEHRRGEAFIIRRVDGTIGAGCKHNSCEWGWRELRERFEPGCYDRAPEISARTETEFRRPDFPQSDLDNAEYFVTRHGRNVRFNVDTAQWHVWNEGLWDVDGKGNVKRLVAESVRSMHALLPNITNFKQREALFRHIHTSESRSRLEAIESLAQSRDGIPIQSAELNCDPMLLNVRNGTIDLRTGELKQHQRGDLISKLCPVAYDREAQCPRWMQFLEEVFQGNADLIGFAKRSVGNWLTGDCREETAWVLYGKAQTGKSKFLAVIRAILGDYAATAAMTTFMGSGERNTYDLADLAGRRFVTASEASDSETFNEPLLKALTGRDAIKCRPIYGRPMEYLPQFKIVFATNELPRIKSQGLDMRRRLKVIPFRQRFYDPDEGRQPVKDDRLLEKLTKELPGVLQWAVEGCLEWQREGLGVPACVKAEIKSIFEQQDPLAEFLEECCVIEPAALVRTSDLYQALGEWSESKGIEPPFKNTQTLSRSLTKRDEIDSIRDWTGQRVFRGIGLLSQLTQHGNSCKPSHEGDSCEGVCANSPDASIASDDENTDALVYACGACKAQVWLTDYKPQVYTYSCESCGHDGIVTHCDYRFWLGHRSADTATAGVQQQSGELRGR